MIKSLSLLTRKDGMTHEHFVKHWVEVHAPLAHRVPGVVRYVQSHIVEERTRPDIPATAVAIDGIAELWYEDRESMARALASPEMKALHADGALFIGRIKSFTVEEKVIVSRPVPAARGIHAVREHLAKLPPPASLTTAQRRAQYDRAERVFPTRADVAIEKVTAPTQPGGVAPAARRPRRRRRALSPRRRLRDRIAALAPPPRGGDRTRGRYRGAPARLSAGPRASLPGRTGGRGGGLRVAHRAGDRAGPHRRGRRLGGRWTHHRHPARPSRPRTAAAGRRGVHLAVGRSHEQRRQLRDQGRGRSHRHPSGRDGDGPGLRGQRRFQSAAGLTALRRPARPAAAVE